jgi:hypothetical protein
MTKAAAVHGIKAVQRAGFVPLTVIFSIDY